MDGWCFCTVPAVVWYDLLVFCSCQRKFELSLLDLTRFAQSFMRSACVRLFADAVIACKDFMRSARVQLFTYAVIGIACAHAFRQDAAHTTLAENRWVSWIWFVEDRSWPYFPPCAVDYTLQKIDGCRGFGL